MLAVRCPSQVSNFGALKVFLIKLTRRCKYATVWAEPTEVNPKIEDALSFKRLKNLFKYSKILSANVGFKNTYRCITLKDSNLKLRKNGIIKKRYFWSLSLEFGFYLKNLSFKISNYSLSLSLSLDLA